VEIRKRFRSPTPRDEAVDRLCRDETLVSLLPGETEIVESQGDRRTTRTRYVALGREGVATFHFTYQLDGNVRFEKVCDGRVWRRLEGGVEVEEDGDGSLVTVEMVGRTKTFVPEVAIKVPLEEQMATMVDALRSLLRG
jgi:hypothetical protein